ncbi:MAG: bifunctional diaminohydroxyphosphoribosylaminopyrimidine deaminase/5-amino-6-(5-phosphoribosylamino)uracil reductase RibD [Prevotella sp.]|nr:bifunctional diaminohydroxyphosphoribosylaminopyrimidine deaminase/5-amino-6-(5-phosphoribosylamino)uracil reductase RibD [Prevotella sp.]
MTTDEQYMRRCLQLARNGRQNAAPNPMVGAVIVSAEGRIIGEGYHVRCGEGHAEVNAFASVRPEDEALLPEATMYVSLEPCSHYGKTPPCADLIVSKGVKRVVVGCIDEFAQVQGRGIKKLQDAGISVTVGVLEAECRALNRRFFTFHRLHRPYIILKWAQTANGFIDDHGCALAISSPFTQMLSHKLRAEEDAILVGRVTDEREHPRLDVRHWSGPSPRRLVLDRQHPLNLESLYHHNVQSLIVEGGRKTLETFLAQNLWDEIRVETNLSLTVSGGTRAPQLPANAQVVSSCNYEQNAIISFRSRQALRPTSMSPT